MATIKSFTSLEQSKKLAEILPIESADMFCADVFDKDKETHSYNFHILSTWGCNTFEELKDKENKFLHFIPCWSLNALLDIIPKRIKDYNVLRIDINEKDTAIWYDEIGYGVNNDLPDITKETAIDTCYEMILKLKEKNLL